MERRRIQVPRPRTPRERIMLAIDRPRLDEATVELIRQLAPKVGAVKIGLELYTAEGPRAVEAVKAAGGRVFLDLKLLDIPNTVRGAARAAARLGVDFLTVHALGGEAMLFEAWQGAVEGAGTARAPALLAVTVLTSLDAAALAAVGVQGTPEEAVLRLARLAIASKIPGLVCSPLEVRALRHALGPDPLLVTPGIRGAESLPDDQRRTLSPREAVEAGSDYLVIGRPILAAPDPIVAAELIGQQIAAADAPRP
ncbi:MAG TPA: orotidine-5'-phosphate decarboxylase [Thermodesulfobacteriota bacterium]